MSEIETPEVEGQSKSSKLEKIKSAAVAAGFYGTCAAITVGSFYYGTKMAKMQFDTAKLNLEAVKLAQK